MRTGGKMNLKQDRTLRDLKQARYLKGLSQTELAEQAGTTQTVISYIEAGHRYPKKDTRIKIRKVVGTVDWLKTRLKGEILNNSGGKDESPEEHMIRAIFIYIKYGSLEGRPLRIKFIKLFLSRLETILKAEENDPK